MRVRVRLRSDQNDFVFPYEYKYQLSSVLYQVMGKSDGDYARFIHDEGFMHGGKYYKLCVTSDLIFANYRATKEGLQVRGNKAEWYISSPVLPSLEHIVTGALTGQELAIRLVQREFRFFVEQVEILEPPQFSRKMTLRCISPIYVSSATLNESGKLRHREVDYFANREKFCEVLKSNLLHKYELLHGCPHDSTLFSFEFDPRYVKKRKGNISNLIDFKPKTPKSRCWRSQFTIETSPELIEIGYECGFGSRNIGGFGMVELS